MKKQFYIRQSEDYARIEKAIKFIEANFKDQPGLDEIAASVHLSKYYFQRLFTRWAGISPTRFLQFLSLEYAKERLNESRSILDTAYDSGLSGPGRLHDLFVNFEAMTPGDFKRLGAGLKIEYGIHPTPFGDCLIAVTERGICHFSFIIDDDPTGAVNQLTENWPDAEIMNNKKSTEKIVRCIFDRKLKKENEPFNLLVRGTNFQINVWRALLSIPDGYMVSYGDIAEYIGKPSAVRAVAGAIAANPVAYLIPCHRVITGSGKYHKYRWGSARKKALLGYEAARLETAG